jgi:hypothetical protein
VQRLRRFGKGVFSVTVSESQALFHANMLFFEFSEFRHVFMPLETNCFKIIMVSARLLLRCGVERFNVPMAIEYDPTNPLSN